MLPKSRVTFLAERSQYRGGAPSQAGQAIA